MGKGTPSLSHALVCPGVTQVMDAVLSRLACPQHDLLLLYYPGQQKVVCVIKSVEHRTGGSVLRTRAQHGSTD